MLQFLLFGEPGHPRQASAFQVQAEGPADELFDQQEGVDDGAAAAGASLDLMPLEDQPARRRQFLRLVANLLVEDLTLLSRPDQQWGSVVADCPVNAMGDTTRRLIQLANLNDHNEVSGEYLAPQARRLASEKLWLGLTNWLAPDGALMMWAASEAPLAAEQLKTVDPLAGPDLATLQRIHAALTTLSGGQ